MLVPLSDVVPALLKIYALREMMGIWKKGEGRPCYMLVMTPQREMPLAPPVLLHLDKDVALLLPHRL